MLYFDRISLRNITRTILSNLYELWKNNKGNKEIQEAVAKIAWALELDLGFDAYGYHSLSELSGLDETKSPEGAEHYKEVIESSIEKLSTSS